MCIIARYEVIICILNFLLLLTIYKKKEKDLITCAEKLQQIKEKKCVFAYM